MQPWVEIAVGIVGGVAILAVGAMFVGRAEGAVYAVAALGCAALGLMLLADVLFAAGITQRAGGGFTAAALAVAALEIGGVSLALLALVLILMGGLTGLMWAARHGRLADLTVPGAALVALVAGAVLTFGSIFGPPLTPGPQNKWLGLAGLSLGTLAAALIAFWAVPIVRGRARVARGDRSREVA